jgi:hypothetical protein
MLSNLSYESVLRENFQRERATLVCPKDLASHLEEQFSSFSSSGIVAVNILLDELH